MTLPQTVPIAALGRVSALPNTSAVIPTPTPTQEPLQIVVATPWPTPAPVIATIPTSKEAMMLAAGIRTSDFISVDYVVSHESAWRHWKWNDGGSRAYGLGQALGPEKMAPYGADFMTNPVTQLKWANAYAHERYGSWANAVNFWKIHTWW